VTVCLPCRAAASKALLMDRYHKEQAEIRYMLDDYVCHVCRSRLASQQAHRLPQTKINLKKYGKKVVHHNINLVSVCSLECNKAVDIGTVNDSDKVTKMLVLILADKIMLSSEIDHILLV
jgi:hypothetical protein